MPPTQKRFRSPKTIGALQCWLQFKKTQHLIFAVICLLLHADYMFLILFLCSHWICMFSIMHSKRCNTYTRKLLQLQYIPAFDSHSSWALAKFFWYKAISASRMRAYYLSNGQSVPNWDNFSELTRNSNIFHLGRDSVELG